MYKKTGEEHSVVKFLQKSRYGKSKCSIVRLYYAQRIVVADQSRAAKTAAPTIEYKNIALVTVDN